MTEHKVARGLAEAEDRVFRARDFRLVSGVVMPEIEIAHITLGELSPTRDNVILLTHGYTSSHRLLGNDDPESSEGGWNLLVGPGRPIDTTRHFVVCSNMLGSSFGSTGPGSIDPRAGRPYGPDFPAISLVDIVAAQKALLDHLGVKRLLAVVGPSLGGYQGFQWAVSYPEMMKGVVATVTSLWPPATADRAAALIERFARDPAWNGGRFAPGAMAETMLAIRMETLRNYGIEARLLETMPDPAARESFIRAVAEPWARRFDPWSLVVLMNACTGLTVAEEASRIRARVLYVLSTTDKLFPPSLAPKVLSVLRAAGVDVSYLELESAHGHQATHIDAAKWAPTLRAFLEGL